MSDCCIRGIKWDSEPVGQETTLARAGCYVVGSNPHIGILLLHDLYGWTFTNTRLLADHFAREVGATVYVPDLFGGEVLAPEIISDQSQWHKLDLPAFMGRNTKAIRTPHLLGCAQEVRSRHGRTGAVGYCFGGWAVFTLGAKGQNLVDCISTAHPSMLEEAEIENVGVPVQIIAPEVDPMFTSELKECSHRIIPGLGLPYNYQYFPGLEHGFAIRGDPKQPAERTGMEQAKDAAVYWFRQWLQQ